MWDVLLLFSSICTAVSPVVVGAPETVIGHRGERVDIRCPYDSGYEANPKYFCKGDCILPNKVIIKSGSPAKDERFSLTDNTTARVFTVTITDLRTEDEGRYWCVVERTLTDGALTDGAIPDVYSEISLKFKLETVIGHRGERVDIRCPYDSGYEANPKYFCKGECIFGIRNIIIRSGSPAKDERFSLTDDTTARVFTVTITDLRTEDEGQYWCAVERTLTTDRAITDVYSEIYLQVKLDKKTTEVSTINPFSVASESEMNPSSSVTDHQISSTGKHLSTSHRPSLSPADHEVKGSSVIIVTAEALVLLLIAVPLVIVAVRKKKKTEGLLSSTIVEFNPVIYEQITDTGRHCNPEDRDTETTVFYSCVS
ncbi:polymeric immunoglobulin receptor-like [Pseudorasbora parva]|uniref:polymeric immunoglobulin receptor-like n=1 Tax=Pseudorasbora parva TaxID=51549 RepID=UPI00351ED12A